MNIDVTYLTGRGIRGIMACANESWQLLRAGFFVTKPYIDTVAVRRQEPALWHRLWNLPSCQLSGNHRCYQRRLLPFLIALIGRLRAGKMSKRIPLTQGKYAIVDDCDYEWLSQWKWCAERNRDTFYAQRRVRRPGGLRLTIRMHRLVANPPPNMMVDHVNRDGLDNRRCNLRVCTHAQNQLNHKRHRTNSSGYRGVLFHRGKWVAKISVNGKPRHLGTFETPEEAARAYDAVAIETRGEFAALNFGQGADQE